MAQSKRLEMENAVLKLDIADASTVVSGSLARDELTEGNDLGWMLHAEPNPETLAEENARLLLGLCRGGRLYEIEQWIATGRSLRTPGNLKKSPLDVGVEQGFHSLVALLARNECEASRKNHALGLAVAKKRLDLVHVLISLGADIKAVSLVDVLLTWDPAMIRFFLDNGADVIIGAPFAVAFGERIRTALRPFVEYKKAHPELVDQLQRQADRALRYFAREGDLKWVSLMLWAGANPYTPGPSVFDEHEDDPDWHTTALREACYKGNLEILKKLKPERQPDELGELLSCALFSKGDDLLGYLLQLGAKPNNKANGGSAALDSCFWHLGFEGSNFFDRHAQVLKYQAHRTLETLRVLVAHGACWRPDDKHQMNSARKSLYRCEPAVTVEVVKILARQQGASPETLEELLAPPRMRQHLSTLGINLDTATTMRSRSAQASHR